MYATAVTVSPALNSLPILTGVCYLLVIIVLLTFFVIRAFKSKYRLDTDCTSNNWIDALITVLTLTTILLGSLLVIASLKYVSESENAIEQEAAPSTAHERVEDFIRRNSQQHSQLPPTVTINRNPSVCSGSWLTAVRSEAYETQRRMSMAPAHNFKIDVPKWKTDSRDQDYFKIHILHKCAQVF